MELQMAAENNDGTRYYDNVSCEPNYASQNASHLCTFGSTLVLP
jgi:hypothetical protein